MRRNTAIVYNVTGQVLELRFPLGRPTSATFAVRRAYADDDAATEFSGTATLDSVNTTTSAAAGPAQTDPQRIPLTSSSSIVTTRKYAIAANGLVEVVQPIEIGSGYIRVRHPLKNDYASGASFYSTTLTAPVDGTFIADRGKLSDLSDTFPDYRVRWAVVYAGATYPLYSFFDVVRAAIEHDVDIEDVTERAPGLAYALPPEYQPDDGRPLVDAAWRSVRAHLAAHNLDANALRDSEAIDELVILRALRLVAEGGWKPVGFQLDAYVSLTTSNYDRFFETHFAVTLKHRTEQQLGAAPQDETRPNAFWRK